MSVIAQSKIKLLIAESVALSTLLILTAGCNLNAQEVSPGANSIANPHLVTYDGAEGPHADGPGAGKHIVFLSGDHEYRSEEILPAMARILAWNFGFKTSVFFTLDEDGFIEPGSSRIAGLEALKSADLLIMGLRFQHFPDEEMQHIVDYLDRAGPIVGIRTSTHAFSGIEGQFAKYNWNYEGDDYLKGFGRQVLGETWAGHYGTNHEQSSLVIPLELAAEHPIFRGVSDVHVQSGGYFADPMPNSTPLAVGRVLKGMTADAQPDPEKEEVPVVWTRSYSGVGSAEGRVFTTTHGASEDFLNDGFRRMMINAALWASGMENVISGEMNVDFIGPYNPVGFAFDGYRLGVRPSDLAGWDTPIMDSSKPTTEDS
jgi:type 1 glutamine amidotransferase